MLTERVQVLLTRAQRRRLEAEAKRRGISMGELIREAVDSRLKERGPVERRRRAVAKIRAMSGGRFLAVQELERIADEEREWPLDQMRRRRRG